MTHSHAHVSTQLRHLIYYHLDCNFLHNALMFAERLHAHEPRSLESAYLLGLCYLRLNQIKAAYDSCRNAVSKGGHLGCSYVFAQACLGLERFGEGAQVLERDRKIWTARNSWGQHTETRRQHLPDAAAVECLQGKLWHGHRDHQKAIECYSAALRVNPFMWDAFTALCAMGAHVRVSNVFRMTPEMMNMDDDSRPLSHVNQAETFMNGHLNMYNARPSTQAPIIHQDPFYEMKTKTKDEGRAESHSFNLQSKAVASYGPFINNDELATMDDTPTARARRPESTTMMSRGGRTELAIMQPPNPLPTRHSTDVGSGDSTSNRLHAAPNRTKSRDIGRHDDRNHAESTSGRSSAQGHVTELKRTISGKVAQPRLSQQPSVESNAPQRKSARLLNQLRPQYSKGANASTDALAQKEDREVRRAKAPSIKGRVASSLTVGRVVSGNRMHTEPMDMDEKERRAVNNARAALAPPTKGVSAAPSAAQERSKTVEALQWLFDLFVRLGTGYFALSHYQCQDALHVFQSLPQSQRDSPWVLAQIGRAYHEQAMYSEAEKVFARLRAIAPARLDAMELYSSTLWHRRNHVNLAFLSHELVEMDRNSPQAWCAVGNSFSLQRDHDQALKCFSRATQLDPSFAYAFTLQGHEHLANEDFDKGLAAFRAAITADQRHYNAWYGLGRVLEKQGKYRQAERHYRTASSINPVNPVLLTCIGVVLEKQDNPRSALVKYAEACLLAERDPLPRFKKAKVLMVLGRPQSALTELQVLKDIAPDEANVHFSLGSVYKMLRQKGEAIRHYTMALNLDPRASHYIKEAMEQIEQIEDLSDEEIV